MLQINRLQISHYLGYILFMIASIIDCLTNQKLHFRKKVIQSLFNPFTIELIDKKPCFLKSKIFDYMYVCSFLQHQFVITVTETEDNYAYNEVINKINNYLF